MSTTSSDQNMTTTKNTHQTPNLAPPVAPLAPPLAPLAEAPTQIDNKASMRVAVENTDRHAFKGIEFLLSVIGLAVGLGNIWRFPTVVYENGGSVFLIPYLLCTFLFAIPAIHLEFALGQLAAKSPPFIFRRIMPVLEGVGWMSAILGGIIGIYYMVLISWIAIYLGNFWNAAKLSKCNNEWNDPKTCYDESNQKRCLWPSPEGWNQTRIDALTNTIKSAKNMSSGSTLSQKMYPKLMFMDGSCQEAALFKNVGLEVGTEQFFTRYVVRKSSGLTDFNFFNWTVFGALVVCWILASFILLRGMKSIGKTSYVTVICPYFIIVILLIRGVLLEGASEGLYFFFRPSDYSALWKYQTWSAALTQSCFSLSIGIGCLMNTASYNKKTHNWYRDVYLLVFCDTLMSILGGAAVFSTLGFLAKQRGVTVPEVVKTGHALAFIVYTEAISHMPVPLLWYVLFFLMLLFLGYSTELVFVEVVCSCFTDRIPYLRKHRWLTVLFVSTTLFLCGLVMATDAGYYWFDLFDEYTAGVSATLGSALTCLIVVYLYGMDNFRSDIVELLGEPRGTFSRIFGPSSLLMALGWQFTSPFCSLIIMGFFMYSREYPFKGDATMYPPLFDIFGWFVSFVPFLLMPVFAVHTIYSFRGRKIPLQGAFMVQKQHPSYPRISEAWPETKRVIGDQLPDFEPGEEEAVVNEREGKNDSIIE